MTIPKKTYEHKPPWLGFFIDCVLKLQRMHYFMTTEIRPFKNRRGPGLCYNYKIWATTGFEWFGSIQRALQIEMKAALSIPHGIYVRSKRTLSSMADCRIFCTRYPIALLVRLSITSHPYSWPPWVSMVCMRLFSPSHLISQERSYSTSPCALWALDILW